MPNRLSIRTAVCGSDCGTWRTRRRAEQAAAAMSRKRKQSQYAQRRTKRINHSLAFASPFAPLDSLGTATAALAPTTRSINRTSRPTATLPPHCLSLEQQYVLAHSVSSRLSVSLPLSHLLPGSSQRCDRYSAALAAPSFSLLLALLLIEDAVSHPRPLSAANSVESLPATNVSGTHAHVAAVSAAGALSHHRCDSPLVARLSSAPTARSRRVLASVVHRGECRQSPPAATSAGSSSGIR